MNTRSATRAEELTAQAAAWRLASLLLERPRPEWHAAIAKLSCEVEEQQLSLAASHASDAAEETYHWAFGPNGNVSPREVSYCGFEDPGRLMAELAAYYHAFSFQPKREESIDHIAVETGFVGYLFLKEAYAEMRDNPESAFITAEARRRFIDEHVQRCARGMIERHGEMPNYLAIVLSWLSHKADSDGDRVIPLPG